MVRWLLLSVVGLAACAGASAGAGAGAPDPASAEPVAAEPKPDGAVAEPKAESPPPSASSSGPWPDRICVAQQAGRAQLVFENDCGCNQALVCSASFDSGDRAIRVTLSIDESRGTFCRDCFAMVPGECDLPKLPANASLTLLINDARAISLQTDARAAPPARCWDVGPGRNG